MAYTLRYYKTLPQPGDRDIVLEIYEKDGVRSSMEIGPVIQALHLDIQGSQEDIDTPVVKTSLVMTFVDAPDHEEASSKKCGNWEEFYTSDSTYWKVLLFVKDSDVQEARQIWGGYVTPDSFTEQLRYRGSVTIVARDNIGHMQDFPFDSKGNEDGMITVYDLVNAAWAKIESPMSLNWRGEEDEAMWLQCEGQDVAGAYLNVSAFKGMNWYEAMEKVLYSIGAVMRYVGNNTVQVSSLRYMPYQGRASMSSLAEIEPKFIAHANRELVPAVRRIEESVKYEVEVMTAIPVEPDDYTGSIESFLIEGNSVDYDGVAWPISQKNSGYGWCNPEKSLFFNPAAYSFWKDRDEDSSFMFIAANNYEISTIYDRYAEYSRYMNAQNAVFRMTVGAPYKITDDGELMNMGYLYEAMTALIVVKAISNGLTSYLQTNGEWGVGKAKIEVPISNGKIELPIDFGDYDGAVLLAVQIHQILTTKSDAAYQHSALYLPVYEVTIGANTPVLERNAINTLYNNDNNVIISRNPEIGPAYNVVAFPRQIKNGIFIKSGDVYLPAKAWAWSGGTPQQMAVYNHLQILCYHAKPNNVITGDIVNADLGNLRALYMWHGSEHLLQGGSLNFLNGRIEGAILREFARYDDMWGDVTGDSMPATEQESSTNVEEGGSSSGSSSTYENTTNVTIGGSGGGSVTVDTFLSDTSTNPVQNRAIKAYVDSVDNLLDEKIGNLAEHIDDLESSKAVIFDATCSTDPWHLNELQTQTTLAEMTDAINNGSPIYMRFGSGLVAVANAELYQNGDVSLYVHLVDSESELIRTIHAYSTADDGWAWESFDNPLGGEESDTFIFSYDSTTNKATAEMVAGLASAITVNKLIVCNGRTYKFILEQDGMYGIVSDAYMDITDGKLKTSILAVTASTYDVQLMEEEVPVGTEITESTVAGWGFTKNAGTITGIKMNGVTKGTSGVVDLGNVLTEHQNLKTINNQSIVGEGNIDIQGGGATPRVEMTASSAVLQPNTFHVWPIADALDLTLGAEQSGVMNRYLFQFRNPKAGLTLLTLPDTITWSEDTELDENGLPVMEATAFYRIEIIEGLASLKKWKLAYIVFADAEVERVLMANGIGDGIGITKRDAKAVTSIGAMFVNNEVVESFEEFEYFSGITEMTGSSWEDGGFRGCTNLKKIKLPQSLQTIFDGSIPGQYSSTGAFKDCTSLEEITIPAGVDIIPTSAFYNCLSLVAVNFDGAVKEFGLYAFAESINLVIEIPSSVEHIDERAFLNVPMKGIVVDCPNLKYLSGIYVFTRSKIRGVESLGNITELRFQSDPPGYYGNYPTFYGCADMEFINLPDTLTHIGRNMFQGCSALRSVTIPHGVGELFTGTFAECYNLEWMKVEAVTPPALYTLDCIDMGSDYPIYVPNASVEAYKGATNWNSYAHRIRGMQDFILGIVTPQSIRCSSSILTAENAVGEKVWSIVGGSEFATITEDGILTILPNASDAEVTIRCTDNNGNIAEKTINVTYNAPLMYLPFDEDFVDAMGNASLLNAVECSIDESKGVKGASMNRPYTAGGLSYQPSFNASFADKSFSVDVWVYLPSNAPNTYLGIAGKRTNASLGASWSFGIKDRKVNIGLSANGGGFTNDFYTDAVIPLERWTRVTMVRDYGRGEYRVYVDTKLVATFGASYALYNGSDGLAVGNYHTDPSNDYFYGNLDEFRIYEGCIFD